MSHASAKAKAAQRKLLRSISGIAGVSDRGVSDVLKWVQSHPEVLEGPVGQKQVPLSHSNHAAVSTAYIYIYIYISYNNSSAVSTAVKLPTFLHALRVLPMHACR